MCSGGGGGGGGGGAGGRGKVEGGWDGPEEGIHRSVEESTDWNQRPTIRDIEQEEVVEWTSSIGCGIDIGFNQPTYTTALVCVRQ